MAPHVASDRSIVGKLAFQGAGLSAWTNLSEGAAHHDRGIESPSLKDGAKAAAPNLVFAEISNVRIAPEKPAGFENHDPAIQLLAVDVAKVGGPHTLDAHASELARRLTCSKHPDGSAL